MKPNAFNKTEKLKRRKLIDQLFNGGKSFGVFPLRVVYAFSDQAAAVPVQAGVSVSTRNFKKAADRNRVKRLLREAYRLNKAELYAHARANGIQLAVFFIYTDKTLPELPALNEKMQLALSKLIKATGEAPAKDH